jgi:hypothetical protein
VNEVYDNPRPKILTLGEMLAEEVNYRIKEKDKVEKQEAINNYLELKSKYSSIERSNNSLQREVEGYKNELNTKKDKISSLKTSISVLAVLSVISIASLIASLNTTNSNSSPQTSNVQSSNEYEQAYKQLSEENTKRQYEIIDLNTQVKRLKAENEQLRNEISPTNSSTDYSNNSQSSETKNSQYQLTPDNRSFLYKTTMSTAGFLKESLDSESRYYTISEGATVYVLTKYDDVYFTVEINGNWGYMHKAYLSN